MRIRLHSWSVPKRCFFFLQYGLCFSLFLSSCAVFRTTESPSRNTNSRPAAKAPASKRPLAVKPKGAYTNYVRDIVRTARTFTGTPYRSGGNDRRGIDCSGLLASVYTEVGLKIPRISWQQAEFGTEIEEVHNIKEGDWIFYVPEAGKAGYVSHVGIVTEVKGKNEILFIHASSSKGVREDNLYSKYFKNRFVKAMRPF
ncbi:C40 family peptidase [Runella sp.]|uniref:C40 family peptidase n=1 Tax=Runella sp. TaxID=1960881 RepID=UPI003D0BC8DA